jgi:uncharacterized membrane protein
MKPELASVQTVAPTVAAPSAMSTLLGLAAGGLVLAAYLIACHVATTQQSPWAPWLYAAPLLAMLFSVVASRWGAWAGALASGLLVVSIAYGLSCWHGERALFYAVQHVCTNLVLCWLFAHTLLGEREPLVTRFARIARRGDMPPEVLSFTRGVTLAWALFFAAVAAVSAGLYVGASIEAWSAFCNLINSPLVGLMFVGEYAVRRYKLRGIRHSAFMDAVQAFRQPWPATKTKPLHDEA